MTANARIVLQDAKFALVAHTNTLQSEHFRISWVAIVTLLRAVGHVLANVDAKTTPAMRAAIEQKWNELQILKPNPLIFWGFIIAERNRFLKTYEHGISRNLTIDGPVMHSQTSQIVIDVGNSRGGTVGNGEALRSLISSGPFSGQPEIQVAWDAYEWWVSYLNDVDKRAK